MSGPTDGEGKQPFELNFQLRSMQASELEAALAGQHYRLDHLLEQAVKAWGEEYSPDIMPAAGIAALVGRLEVMLRPLDDDSQRRAVAMLQAVLANEDDKAHALLWQLAQHPDAPNTPAEDCPCH